MKNKILESSEGGRLPAVVEVIGLSGVGNAAPVPTPLYCSLLLSHLLPRSLCAHYQPSSVMVVCRARKLGSVGSSAMFGQVREARRTGACQRLSACIS
jgi:hypothetical protein